MQLQATNLLLAKGCVRKMSLSARNILAFVADGCDTCLFMHFVGLMSYVELFCGMSKPSGNKSSLSWSPNGNMLALGSTTLQLWKLGDNQLLPMKTFTEDFIEIQMIAWNPDCTSLAYGGVSRSNSIKIRHLDGHHQQISLELSLCALSYDPFGKYLLLLLASNVLQVHSSNNYCKTKEIKLSPNASSSSSINAIKELRTMSWEPGFTRLVCPSLDDTTISLAACLNRKEGFEVDRMFLGHASSICSAKFSPKIYQWLKEPTSIVALGDSTGIVSLWRVGNSVYPQPLLIAKTPAHSSEVVEDMEWDNTGQLLLVNVLQKYIRVMSFNTTKFGIQLTEAKQTELIQETFGARSASQINKTVLQVFSSEVEPPSPKTQTQQKNRSFFLNGNVMINQTENSAKIKMPLSTNFEPFSHQQHQYVKIQQQKVTIDQNKRKKIQPNVLVRKDQIEKNVELMSNAHFEIFKLKQIKFEGKSMKIGQSVLEIRRLTGCTIVQLWDANKTLVNERMFQGAIDYITVKRETMYILLNGNLYIFDHLLNIVDLPIRVGDVHRLAINHHSDVFYISTKGIIRGFNHRTQQCYTPCLSLPVPPKKIEEKIDEDFDDILEQFTIENDCILSIVFVGSSIRYFYNRKMQCWVSLQFNQGLFKQGSSLIISPNQSQLCANFFSAIRGPPIREKFKNDIQFYECNLIYYSIHNKNRLQYLNNLFSLLSQMKNKGMDQRLRTAMIKYFIDTTSKHYESDPQVRQKARNIGGHIIQQFILFNQL